VNWGDLPGRGWLGSSNTRVLVRNTTKVQVLLYSYSIRVEYELSLLLELQYFTVLRTSSTTSMYCNYSRSIEYSMYIGLPGALEEIKVHVIQASPYVPHSSTVLLLHTVNASYFSLVLLLVRLRTLVQQG
jgi:hypothetical protein